MAVSMSAARPCTTRVQGMRVAAPVRAVRAQAFNASTKVAQKVSFRSTAAPMRPVFCEAKKSVGDLSKADLEVRKACEQLNLLTFSIVMHCCERCEHWSLFATDRASRAVPKAAGLQRRMAACRPRNTSKLLVERLRWARARSGTGTSKPMHSIRQGQWSELLLRVSASIRTSSCVLGGLEGMVNRSTLIVC